MKQQQNHKVRLSHLTFTILLEEMLSGPCTAQHLSEHTGMGHRYIRELLRTMRARKVAHISGYDKDSLGRVSVQVFALGPGKDAPRRAKPRTEINRDYRAKRERAVLKGTPFYGLGA